jgi:phosphatidylglycerophosphate synthase
MSALSTVVLECGPAQGHLLRVGGLTVVERRIRELAREGVACVVVVASPVEFGRPLPVEVAFVAADADAPAGAPRERGDVLRGVHIVDEATRRAAERRVVRSMNKSFEGPVDSLLTWRLSNPITRALSYRSLRLTPNHVTLVAICVGLATCAVMAQARSYWAFALAGALLELNSVLDTVDGELARLRFQYSRLGQWLDNVSDDVIDNLFIASAGFALGGVWTWLGLLGASGRVIVAIYTYVTVFRATGTGDVFAFRWWFESEKVATDDVYDPLALTTWLRSLGRRDTYVFCWAVACVAGVPQWVAIHGAVIGSVQLGLLALQHTIGRQRRRTAAPAIPG